MVSRSARPEVVPMSAHLGAEIHGFDLQEPLADDGVTFIREVLRQWKLVVVRDQALDDEAQMRLARTFGPLAPAHPHDNGGSPIYRVDSDRFRARYGPGEDRRSVWRRHTALAGWHTDVTP